MKSSYYCSIKILSFIFIISALQGCGLVSMMVDEEFEKVDDTLNLNLNKNGLTFPVLINNNETSLVFDTGSTIPFLYDEKVLNNRKPDKISNFGKVNYFGNKLDFYRTPLSFENDLFKSNNTVFVVLPDLYALNDCSKREVTGGFYGKYFLDKILNLNFEHKKLFILDSLKTTTYTEIESKFFDLIQIQIKLNVNGKSEWFHFDTGNVLYPIIVNQNSEVIKDAKYDFNVKSNRLSLVEKQNSTYYYQNYQINFADEQISSYVISNSGIKENKYNNVGLQFIKNYNWIIDYKNQKVYHKNYNQSRLNPIQVSKGHLNKSAVENGKLVVIQMLDQIENQNYDLGDQILSVNGASITPENICSYQELLNNSDWHILDIETQ
ncbi:hypothetical protein [Psychroflexus lacisalsi]|jgi:hypothetical protein|uniref:PDZ domain-containing protein n=1 Tax=Psychroflexus lacisalsi TaxID=503928 RepID=A0ABN1K4Z9_9FLAO|nr:hypothetical protein [Psychroflexus lacisalsi]MBZ9619032.1 hypothetical protein [Psychroflexus lacisalsi]